MSSILPDEDLNAQSEADIQEKLLNWWTLLYTACKNFWWIILLCLVTGVSFQAYKFSKEKPTFVSRAELIMTGRLLSAEKTAFQEFEMLGTQVALLQSNRLKERAAQSMEVFHPTIEKSWVNISSFIREDTTIYVIEARGGAAEYTEKYLDALIKEYLLMRKEMRTQTSNDVLVSRTDQLKKVEADIEELEEEMVQFQRTNNLMFIQEKGSSAGREMSSIQNEIVQLQTRLRMLETLPLEQIIAEFAIKEKGTQEKGLFESFRYTATKNKIDSLSASLEEFSLYLKPKHPKIIKLRAALEEEKTLLSIHESSVQEEISELRKFLRIKIDNLQKVAQEWQSSALDMSRLNAEYDRIQSRLERARSLYDNLVKTIQSIDINAGEAQNRIEIHEPPSVAYAQMPMLSKAIASGVVMGLAGAASILVMIMVLDNRIIKPENLDKYPDIPLLAYFAKDKTVARETVFKLITSDQDSPMRQSMQSLQSSFFTDPEFKHPPRSFLITSSTPEEGKSTSSTVVATMLAQNGHKTLLIDADLHRGKLHQTFDKRSSPGLSKFLEKQTDLLEELIRPTALPNLFLISSGMYMKDCSAQLRADRMAKQMAYLKEHFDYIIVDTPPIIASNDALILSEYVDHILFCVRAESTRHRQIQYCLKKLIAYREKVSGFLLTFAKKESSQYNDYYQNY